MTFYDLGGARGLTPVSYDAYNPKQTNYWRYTIALLLFLAILGTSTVVKALASIEQSDIELPKPAYANSLPPVPAENAAAAAVDRSPELDSALKTWQAQQTDSEWAFYVNSLDSDELKVGINDTKQFELASIYKLFLLKPLAQKIPAEAWSNTSVTERSYQDCVIAMLSVSDNLCAEAIAGRTGWSVLHRQNQADGYKSTVLNRADFLAGSAADTGLLLDRLYSGDGFDAKTKEIALGALGKSKRTEAIRKGCSGCIVYNKTGDFNGARNDAAIVEKNGKTYVVVIFSKGASWGQLVQASSIINNYL